MKTKNYLLMAGTVILMSAFTISNSIKWTISENYSIKFSGVEAEGTFSELTGDVVFDENDLENSSFSMMVAVNSINTGNGTKNKHAKSAKWFDAETYPNMTFKSNKVSYSDKGYTVTGIMDIHGVSKEMTIPFTFENNTFKSTFAVNRTDFNIGSMKGMSKKVSDEMTLEISIPVKK